MCKHILINRGLNGVKSKHHNFWKIFSNICDKKLVQTKKGAIDNNNPSVDSCEFLWDAIHKFTDTGSWTNPKPVHRNEYPVCIIY